MLGCGSTLHRHVLDRVHDQHYRLQVRAAIATTSKLYNAIVPGAWGSQPIIFFNSMTHSMLSVVLVFVLVSGSRVWLGAY